MKLQNVNPYSCKCPFAPCFTITTIWSGSVTEDNYTFYIDCEVEKNGNVIGLPYAADCEETRNEVKAFWSKLNKLEKRKTF